MRNKEMLCVVSCLEAPAGLSLIENVLMSPVHFQPGAFLIVRGSRQIAFFLLLKHQHRNDGESLRLET